MLQSTDRKRSIGLSWRPNDPLAKRTRSRALETNDLLLKITLPKRTGRKRKRGSSGQYEFEGAASADEPDENTKPYKIKASDLLDRLINASEKISVVINGYVQETYRFRGNATTIYQKLFIAEAFIRYP